MVPRECNVVHILYIILFNTVLVYVEISCVSVLQNLVPEVCTFVQNSSALPGPLVL